MSSDATVQLLTPEGKLVSDDRTSEYLPWIEKLPESRLLDFHRQMVVMRRFDTEAGNLQRQGQLALWIPSIGQEAAQVGSAYAAAPQDHLFPAYREHVVGRVRGLDPMRIIEMLRGLSHGGWVPSETGNFHLYTLVIGSQALHATGYAMGIALDRLLDVSNGGAAAPRDPEKDAAVLVYFGDGASSQGDVSEAFTFAASYQTPQVFFLQNNHWAISVPVTRQSRTPLYLRAGGFGMPGTQVDGNDVLASYAVTAKHLDDARAGKGPALIEAMTYRVGAHTTADDPTKYRDPEELAAWVAKDPIVRFRAYLQGLGVEQDFLDAVDEEAEDHAADVRRRALEIRSPERSVIFDNVYAEPHPLIQEQKAWLDRYEASFEGGDA